MIDKFEKREKSFLAMRKRYDEINREIRRIPWKKLDVPVMDGWDITLQIREEERRSEEGPFFEEALKICSSGLKWSLRRGGQVISDIRKNPSFSHCKDYFKVRNSEGFMIYYGPSLNKIDERVWKAIEIPQVAKLFVRKEREVTQRWGGQIWKEVSYIPIISDYMLVLHTKKRMLTQEKDIDPKLLKEKAFLSNKLEEYWREHGHYYHWDSDNHERRHTKDALRHFINGELDDINDYSKLNKYK